MTATITPVGKDHHPVVPVVLLAVALVLGVSTLARHSVPFAPPGPAAVRTVPTTETPNATVPTAPTSVPTSARTAVVPGATVPAAPVTAAPVVNTGCADALAYLGAHAAPGFVSTCAPGSALGHYGYSCAEVPGRCEGVRVIHIACPAPFVYMNEAHNSWTVIGRGSGIDPYGQGTAAEQSYCNRFR